MAQMKALLSVQWGMLVDVILTQSEPHSGASQVECRSRRTSPPRDGRTGLYEDLEGNALAQVLTIAA